MGVGAGEIFGNRLMVTWFNGLGNFLQ